MNLNLGSLKPADVDRMTDKLFLGEGPDSALKVSSFWVLLALAGIIASAGVTADSTATVIGAMIVAPLMTPILATALAIVLVERRALLFSAGTVVVGVLLVIGIGYVFGMLSPIDMTATTNSQVASRVSPRIVDLIAALATGAVGSFALVRSDISDTLPGVAIAISLVPPLAVVGLTLESGAGAQAFGAFLLFMTNVTAIIATGMAVLLAYGIRDVAAESGRDVGVFNSRAAILVWGVLGLLAIPLGYGTYNATQSQLTVAKITPVANAWVEDSTWQVVDVSARQGVVRVVVLGQPPNEEVASFKDALAKAGLSDIKVHVSYVYGGTTDIIG